MLGLSVWKGLRMRMMSRPDRLVSVVKSSETCEDVLFVMISSLTLPFTVGAKNREGCKNNHVIRLLPVKCKSIWKNLDEALKKNIRLPPEIAPKP